jgi:hypothetical protein
MKEKNLLRLPVAVLARLRVAGFLVLAIFGFQSAAILGFAGEDYYGTRENSEAGLVGIIYDLKQTPKRTPTGVDPTTYPGIINKFLAQQWDEAVLNPYFRAARPLYTTQIFVPMMGSEEAPKAFGMEAIIKPSCWAIHYKGQVSPPEDGVYRFVGGGDDFIAVAVRGKTVLFQCWWAGTVWGSKVPIWTPTAPPVVLNQHSPIVSGDWVSLKKGQPVDLDVMFGEWPGGQSQAILLYQKQGVTYPTDETGSLVLPIFQLAPYDTPVPPLSLAPHFLKGAPVWKGYQ